MTSLTLVRRIAARPELVFDAFVEPELILKWWGPDDGPVLLAETDIRIGGRFRVRFRAEDGIEHECSGDYLELERPTRIAMSWAWAGDEDEHGQSQIEIDLRPIDTGTELTFTHSRLASKATRITHESGWIGALAKLVRLFSETDSRLAN